MFLLHFLLFCKEWPTFFPGLCYYLARENLINVCGTKLKCIFPPILSIPFPPILSVPCTYSCQVIFYLPPLFFSLLFVGRISISDFQHFRIQDIAEVLTAVLRKEGTDIEWTHHFACYENWRQVYPAALVALLPFCTFPPRWRGARLRCSLHGPEERTIHGWVLAYRFYTHVHLGSFCAWYLTSVLM